MITTTLPAIVPYTGILPNKATQTPNEFIDLMLPMCEFYSNTNLTQLKNWSNAFNSISIQANATFEEINIIKNNVDSYKTSTYNYMNTTETYKNEALGAKNDILGYVIPNGTAYSIEQADESFATLGLMIQELQADSLKIKIEGVN